MIRRPLLALLVLVLALPACDTNEEQNSFFVEAEQRPNAYTATSETGAVLELDADDWRVAPAFRGAVEVTPAFPNPVTRGGLVSLTIQDTFDDAIVGGIFVSGRPGNNPGQTLRLAEDNSAGPVYVLDFNPNRLRLTTGDDAQLFRVRVFTQDFRLITYGDILVR